MNLCFALAPGVHSCYIYVYIYGLYKVLRLFWLCILCILEPHTANGHFYQFGVGSLNLAMYFTVSSSMLTFKYIIVCNVTKITQLFLMICRPLVKLMTHQYVPFICSVTKYLNITTFTGIISKFYYDPPICPLCSVKGNIGFMF